MRLTLPIRHVHRPAFLRHFVCIVVLMTSTLSHGFSNKQSVSAGADSSALVDAKGDLYTWGDDSQGQLGLGRVTQYTSPVNTGSSYTALASADTHTLALKADGTLWAWGNNENGQIGDGTYTTRPTPTRVGSGYVQIAAGGRASFGLKADGSLWAWGLGLNGVFGLGNRYDQKSQPTKVGDGFKSFSVTNYHALALKIDNTLWAWGENQYGAIGNGTTNDQYTPLQIGKDFKAVFAGRDRSFAIKSDDTLWAWGANGYGSLGTGLTSSTFKNELVPTQIGSGYIIVSSNSFNTTVAVKRDGSLWGWGDNTDGQLTNLPKTVSLPTQMASGYQSVSINYGHALGIKQDGTLWAWGNNKFGELGDGTTESRSTPMQINGSYTSVVAGGGPVGLSSMALDADGKLLVWGDNSKGQLGIDPTPGFRTSPTKVGSGYAAVSVGRGFMIALKRDGTLWGWGSNFRGQVGDGTGINRNRPVQIGTGYSAIAAGPENGFALKPDGSLWGWGFYLYAGTGKYDNAQPPAKIGDGFRSVSAGYQYVLAVKADDSLWAWGYNLLGEFGDGSTQQFVNFAPKQVGSGFDSVAAGTGYSLGIKKDHSLWAWGWNSIGQLGDGTRSDQLTPKLIGTGFDAVTTSSLTGQPVSFAAKSDGSTWAWGASVLAGTGNAQFLDKPTRLNQRYDNIAIGSSHTIVTTPNAALLTMGSSNYGQLGNGTTAYSAVPANVVNPSGDAYLGTDGDISANAANPFNVLQIAQQTGDALSSTLTDTRASGFDGEVFFTALLPANSPLIPKTNGFADATGGQIPVVLGRGGVKQTGPGVPGSSSYNGAITSGNQFAVYTGAASDPLSGSNAVICMGVTLPALSAKGQVLMRPIATGTSVKGIAQCPTVQTAATTKLYRATATGDTSRLTLSANVTPQDEDRGQTRNLYSWAVAPDGTQYMQTGPNQWAAMQEPMLPASTVTVPRSGDVTLSVLDGLDLTSLRGTLVYIGLGSSWEEVRQLNKAGHYYTIQ